MNIGEEFLMEDASLDDNDESSYPSFIAELEEKSGRVEKQIFVKQTLALSPTIMDIIPQFKVKTNKAFKRSFGILRNDREYQSFLATDEDSQIDAFDEIDEIYGDILEPTSSAKYEPVSIAPIFEYPLLLVRKQSLVIDEIEYPLKAPVRSCCVIRASAAQEEDHLLVSLLSGFLLLLRIYRIPIHVRDNDYEYQAEKLNDEDRKFLVFKPFIIQWWNLSSKNKHLDLSTSGFSLKASPSGFSAVSCSASNSFRLYMVLPQSPNGTVLKNHINVALGGFLVDSCFIKPMSSASTDMFLTLVYTEQRRLFINLYSWSNFFGSCTEVTKSTYPLENSFEIPVFIVPLEKNSAFLFVSSTSLSIISIHEVISAQYSLRRTDAPWNSFPTCFYLPRESSIINSTTMVPQSDEVIIATDNGVLYSLLISNNEFLSISPILRISDSPSAFTLEKRRSGDYHLLYTSFGGSNRSLIFESIYNKEYYTDISDDNRLEYCRFQQLEKFASWAPIRDVTLANKSRPVNSILSPSQELWGITGLGKKSKLTLFKTGYDGCKIGGIYDKLRKVTNVWTIMYEECLYLMCSLPFESVLLEVIRKQEEEEEEDDDEEEEEDSIVEIGDHLINREETTIFACVVRSKQNHFIIQITSHTIVLSNLSDIYLTGSFEYTLILAEVVNDTLIVICDDGGKIYLRTYRFTDKSFDDVMSFKEALTVAQVLVLEYDPCLLKKCSFGRKFDFAIGDFSGGLHFYRFEEQKEEEEKDVVVVLRAESVSFRNLLLNKNLPKTQDIVPNDLVCVEDEIFIGTKDGYYLKLVPQENSIICDICLRVAESSITFERDNESKVLFIICNDLFIVDPRNSQYPERVVFNESQYRSITAAILLPLNGGGGGGVKKRKFALFRNNGLVLAEIFMHKKALVRQIKIPDTSKKVMYLEYLSLFLILCESKVAKDRLTCVDRKTFKVVSNVKMVGKNKEDTGGGGSIFNDDEIPISFCIWEIDRNGKKTSHKVVVGCSKSSNNGKQSGLVKVLDLKKTKTDTDQGYGIAILELTTFDHARPVTHIQQWQDQLLFASGSSIWTTLYDENEKRLTTPKSIHSFPSEVTSFTVQEDKILVCTRLDSIQQCTLNQGKVEAIGRRAPSEPFVSQLNYKSTVIGSNKLTCEVSVMKIKSQPPALWYIDRGFTIKLPGIARILCAKLDNPWINTNKEESTKDNDEEISILCVTVSGSIIALRSVGENSEETKMITDQFNKNCTFKLTLEEHLKKLDRPFEGKNAGTGLFSLNKPYFERIRCDSAPSSSSPSPSEIRSQALQYLDYDLEEVSTVCLPKIGL
ncbi:hypothetical protein KGF56_000058 [Candida oxycetoniae]|uniref:Cleavage/polyadenylation specificity factor A subunit N-terminal domain-containing protein n=1 Tax=Candida oxycetoniae TaxID=497107 RepID=A0AAI9T2D9_9ASCO|nr:uncharacterized protein KGF56_000058 [Candida oxycetoniae]KAI3407156.2 hypothetical protein KGF56_000058 [Candida oxycetoniae]